jgi:hypothetical protein
LPPKILGDEQLDWQLARPLPGAMKRAAGSDAVLMKAHSRKRR